MKMKQLPVMCRLYTDVSAAQLLYINQPGIVITKTAPAVPTSYPGSYLRAVRGDKTLGHGP